MKIATRSVLTVGFCLLVAGFVTNAFLLPHAEAQNHARKNQTKAISSAPATGPAVDAVVINELDADQEGTDAAEFVELRAAPNTSFDGYVLVFYTGSTDTSYLAIDLDGLTADANGLVLIGNAGVPGVDRTFGDNVLQQGEDAVALYLADATAFPNGTAVTAASIVDAVVYDTNDPDDPGLMGTLLNPGPAQVQINESMFGTPTSHAIRRCSDGVRDGRAFTVGIPTPNAPNNNCPDGKVDLNGDGKSDYLIARPLGGGAATLASGYDSTIRLSRRERFKAMQAAADAGPSALIPIQWWGLENGTSGIHAVEWGDFATDEPITADFDRDGKDDIAVWRPAEANEKAYFYSIDSSNFSFRATPIGQLDDNPYVIGDYDGDGFDDPAVFRCPQAPGTCYFYYLASSVPNSGFYAVPFGFGQVNSLLPYVGDFNGDGKTDFGVQDQSPFNPNNGIFYIGINGSSDVSGVEWGLLTDRLVPGDFDGDGKSDITVSRDVNDVLWWYVLEQDGGMQFVPWGQGGDFQVPGDFNGDGRDDFTVYRWNANDATFLVQPSGGGSHFGLSWGQTGDYPAAYYFVQ